MSNLCLRGESIAEQCQWYWHDDNNNEPTEWKNHLENCDKCYSFVCQKERLNDNR